MFNFVNFNYRSTYFNDCKHFVRFSVLIFWSKTCGSSAIKRAAQWIWNREHCSTSDTVSVLHSSCCVISFRMLLVRSHRKWYQSQMFVSGSSHRSIMFCSKYVMVSLSTGSGRKSCGNGLSWSAELREYSLTAMLWFMTDFEPSTNSKFATRCFDSRDNRSFSGHISGQTPCVLVALLISTVFARVKRINLSRASSTWNLQYKCQTLVFMLWIGNWILLFFRCMGWLS